MFKRAKRNVSLKSGIVHKIVVGFGRKKLNEKKRPYFHSKQTTTYRELLIVNKTLVVIAISNYSNSYVITLEISTTIKRHRHRCIWRQIAAQ